MKWIVALLLTTNVLLGCKDDLPLSKENIIDRALLQKYNWESRSEIEEQSVEWKDPYRYAKLVSMKFTENQFNQKIDSYFLVTPIQTGSVKLTPNLPSGSISGDYEFSERDSILTFTTKVTSNSEAIKWDVKPDTMEITSQYKVQRLNNRTLELKPISKIQIDGIDPVITFYALPISVH